MKFVNLEEKEFDKFASKHPYTSFYQTSSWGHLKESNGWNMHLLGVKDNNKVIAATLLLSKKTPIGYYMFYAPRGFLIDYNNFEILDFFTKNIKKYTKESVLQEQNIRGMLSNWKKYLIDLEDINFNCEKNMKSLLRIKKQHQAEFKQMLQQESEDTYE